MRWPWYLWLLAAIELCIFASLPIGLAVAAGLVIPLIVKAKARSY